MERGIVIDSSGTPQHASKESCLCRGDCRAEVNTYVSGRVHLKSEIGKFFDSVDMVEADGQKRKSSELLDSWNLSYISASESPESDGVDSHHAIFGWRRAREMSGPLATDHSGFSQDSALSGSTLFERTSIVSDGVPDLLRAATPMYYSCHEMHHSALAVAKTTEIGTSLPFQVDSGLSAAPARSNDNISPTDAIENLRISERAPRFSHSSSWGFLHEGSNPPQKIETTLDAPEDYLVDWYRLTSNAACPEVNSPDDPDLGLEIECHSSIPQTTSSAVQSAVDEYDQELSPATSISSSPGYSDYSTDSRELLDPDEIMAATSYASLLRALVRVGTAHVHRVRSQDPPFNFMNGLGSQNGYGASSQAPDDSVNVKGKRSSNATCQSPGSSSAKRQRRVSEDEHGPDDGTQPCPRSTEPVYGGSSDLYFACPFHKADPTKFSAPDTEYKHCGTCRLKTISAVKQHIGRHHKWPKYYCAVCWAKFGDATTRDKHSQLRKCAPSSENPFLDKLDDDVWERVSIKKSRGETEHQWWYNLFAIIYPDHAWPKSPYQDNHTAGWHDFALRTFRALGPTARDFYGTLPSLPPLNQAIIDHALEIFDAESRPELSALRKMRQQVSQIDNSRTENWFPEYSTSPHSGDCSADPLSVVLSYNMGSQAPGELQESHTNMESVLVQSTSQHKKGQELYGTLPDLESDLEVFLKDNNIDPLLELEILAQE